MTVLLKWKKNWEMRNLEKIRSNQMTVQFYMAVTSSFPACFFPPSNLIYYSGCSTWETVWTRRNQKSRFLANSQQALLPCTVCCPQGTPHCSKLCQICRRDSGGGGWFCKRGLQLQKSDGWWCQEGTVKHMQPLALLGHPVPCMSAARCALHNIWIHCTLCVQVPRNSSFMSSE